MLFGVSVAYSGLLICLGLVFARYLRIRNVFIWGAFGLVSWVLLLLAGGQHVPVIGSFTSNLYCFGVPGVVHFVSLLLPPVAIAWVLRSAAELEDSNEPAA